MRYCVSLPSSGSARTILNSPSAAARSDKLRTRRTLCPDWNRLAMSGLHLARELDRRGRGGRATRATSQSEMAAGQQALGIARRACPADVGPERVDRARGGLADDADQGGAAGAGAAHAAPARVDELGRNARDLGVAFERQTRPLRRVGTARAAASAVERVMRFDTLDRRRR